MDPEHIDSVKNIFTYLANQQAAGTAVSLAAKGMSANEALSRAYNIAREMVSPTYVASEVTIRMLQKEGADALLMSLQSPDAAAIMEKILRFPKLVTPKELKTFDTLVTEFLFTEVARKGQRPHNWILQFVYQRRNLLMKKKSKLKGSHTDRWSVNPCTGAAWLCLRTR